MEHPRALGVVHGVLDPIGTRERVVLQLVGVRKDPTLAGRPVLLILGHAEEIDHLLLAAVQQLLSQRRKLYPSLREASHRRAMCMVSPPSPLTSSP